jgi:hypothetical protein
LRERNPNQTGSVPLGGMIFPRRGGADYCRSTFSGPQGTKSTRPLATAGRPLSTHRRMTHTQGSK